MKGENDEGGRSIDGMMVWAEHLYILYQQGDKDVPEKCVLWEHPEIIFVAIFKKKK